MTASNTATILEWPLRKCECCGLYVDWIGATFKCEVCTRATKVHSGYLVCTLHQKAG